jgi:CheY-like chemotaxis protein
MSIVQRPIQSEDYGKFEPLMPRNQCLSLGKISKSIKPSVLSIDNNKICQKVNKTLLEKLGCFVELADTAKEALENCATAYEIIFLEIRLTDFPGEKLVDFIRHGDQSRNKSTPIIIISNWIDVAFKKKCFFMKIDAVFTKPMLIENFKAVLQKYTHRI